MVKRKFTTMTADLLALADWLAEHQVTRVGMGSTSDYWKPIFYVLEDRFECWLLNARHMRAVPGRKTDMTDAEWICDLVAHGLVRPSFVPPPPMRRLRDLTRRRTLLLAERSREKRGSRLGGCPPIRTRRDRRHRLHRLTVADQIWPSAKTNFAPLAGHDPGNIGLDNSL